MRKLSRNQKFAVGGGITLSSLLVIAIIVFALRDKLFSSSTGLESKSGAGGVPAEKDKDSTLEKGDKGKKSDSRENNQPPKDKAHGSQQQIGPSGSQTGLSGNQGTRPFLK